MLRIEVYLTLAYLVGQKRSLDLLQPVVASLVVLVWTALAGLVGSWAWVLDFGGRSLILSVVALSEILRCSRKRDFNTWEQTRFLLDVSIENVGYMGTKRRRIQ